MDNIKYITEMCSIDVTYRCNFRCKHCYNNSGEHNFGEEELSDEELLRVIDELIILKPRVICFCGGEPLLRKEIVFKMAKKFSNATNNQCNMVTNGYLINESVANEIKESGIKLVQISLDGASPKAHNWLRNNDYAFEKAINALKILNKVGLMTGVACTPSKVNIQEIDKLIDLCVSLGVNDFRMQPLMKMGRANTIDQYFLNEYEYFKLRRLLIKKSAEYGDIINIEWGDPLLHLANYAEGTNRFNMLIINGYGNITTSPYLPIVIGNIRKHSIQEYIDHNFANVLNNNFFRKVASLLQDSKEMDINKVSMLPSVFTGNDIILDVFENDIDLLGNELIKKYNL